MLILEGARAVGKTTLVRNRLESAGYSYASLADPATLALAKSDQKSWLERLPRPAIIDEAQLLPDLPLLLKEVVDGLLPETHFVLTGSASIGRTGLGGADPLTRRSRRFVMYPLTQWEIAGLAGSIVDHMFDSDVIMRRFGAQDDSDLLSIMRVGGFPGQVLPRRIRTQRQSFEQIRSDVQAVLGDTLLPGIGIDAFSAHSALDDLLRSPGAIFNASRISARLDVDRRTVDRYLGVFERLFLVHWLPNLATTPSRQSHARAKIHPVDTSFSIESLHRAGVDLLANREAFGAVLESHVVNQVLAAAGWSELGIQPYFWRQASGSSFEVDLVLVDQSDRVVGIEVKASKSVHPRDAASLEALRRSRGLHRGFIFYTGSETIQLAENIWAIPVAALADDSGFVSASAQSSNLERALQMNDQLSSNGSLSAPGAADATMFLSYVHSDDEHSRGRIVQFAKDLVAYYDFLFGRKISLFVDRDSLEWGVDWRARLLDETQSTSFLLAVVTPRYLQSQACRSEFLQFSAAAQREEEPRLLLPLVWVDVSSTDVVAADDPVLSKIASTQFLDVGEIRRLVPNSIEYDQLLEEVATRLKATVDARDASGSEAVAKPREQEDDRDLLEVMEALEARQGALEEATGGFKNAFDRLGAVFTDRPTSRPTPTYAGAAQMAKLGADLAVPVEGVEVATKRLAEVWADYDSAIARAAIIVRDSPDASARRGMFESLDGLVRSLELPGADVVEEQLTMMGNISRHLRPMSHAVGNALRALQGIQASARAWRDQLVRD